MDFQLVTDDGVKNGDAVKKNLIFQWDFVDYFNNPSHHQLPHLGVYLDSLGNLRYDARCLRF